MKTKGKYGTSWAKPFSAAEICSSNHVGMVTSTRSAGGMYTTKFWLRINFKEKINIVVGEAYLNIII
jgi:hypothetical protein